jgi:hypothetical protein
MQHLGPYSKLFVFCVTYKGPNKLECLFLTDFSSLLQCNTQAYCSHSKVMNKNNSCEWGTWGRILSLVRLFCEWAVSDLRSYF